MRQQSAPRVSVLHETYRPLQSLQPTPSVFVIETSSRVLAFCFSETIRDIEQVGAWQLRSSTDRWCGVPVSCGNQNQSDVVICVASFLSGGNCGQWWWIYTSETDFSKGKYNWNIYTTINNVIHPNKNLFILKNAARCHCKCVSHFVASSSGTVAFL
jgi:hypothetical protein